MPRRSGLIASLVIVVLSFLAWWLWPVAEAPTQSHEEPPPAAIMRAPVAADPEPETPIAGSISGTVHIVGGRGNAVVCAWPLADDERVRDAFARHCTLPEMDGHYRIGELEGGRYRVTASLVKYLPSIWRDVEHGGREWLLVHEHEQRSGVDLRLLPGGLRLAGVVEDVAGGPIPGALVVASTMHSPGPVDATFGDDEGRFELWVAPNQYSLLAIASGYAEGGAFAQAPNEALTIRLVPESVLVGHVIDAASNEPLAGVEVRASVHDRKPAISSEDGSFRVGGLRPGRYQPEASGEGVYGKLERSVVLGLGQTSEPIELRVYPAYRVSGQLLARSLAGAGGTGARRKTSLDGRERGCAEGSVSVRGSMVTREVSADADGQVRIEGLPADRYRISLRCPGHVAPDSADLLLDADLDDQRWLFEAGLEIAGIAVDESDRPLPGLWVHAEGDAGAASIARSDADGRFVLGPLPAGSYGVWLRIEADKPIEVELRERSLDDVRLVAGASGTVEVSARDADGKPIVGKYVYVQGRDGRSLGQAITDGEGTVSFGGLPVGSVHVALAEQVEPGGSRKPRGVRVEIVAGELAQVELRGEASSVGRISGIVTEASGPAGEAWVVAGRGQAEGDGYEVGPVLCEQDGRFTLSDLPAGTWRLRAYREGGGQAIESGVALGESVRLDLDSPASLFGHVRFADGSAPEHFEVSLSPAHGESPITLSFYRSEGRFEFEDVPAGRYTVEVDAGSGQASEKLALASGERTELEFVLERRITVTGRLVDANTKVGVSALEIQVHRRGRATTRTVRPDRDGNFVLDNVPVGAVELGLTPRSWENPSYAMQFVWITTAAGQAEQNLGDVLVVGRRRARGESKGDVGFDFEFDGRLGDSDKFGEVSVRVKAVDGGGPAQAAGLREGDVITAVDGVSVVGGDARRMGLLIQVAAGASLTLDRASGGPVTIVAGGL
jgi:hypothetical protein